MSIRNKENCLVSMLVRGDSLLAMLVRLTDADNQQLSDVVYAVRLDTSQVLVAWAPEGESVPYRTRYLHEDELVPLSVFDIDGELAVWKYIKGLCVWLECGTEPNIFYVDLMRPWVVVTEKPGVNDAS